MEKDAGQVFSDLKDDVVEYAELRFELLKLSAYEQAGKIIGVLSYGILLSAVALIAVFFAHLVLGFFLSQWLGSFGFGFGIILIMYAIQVVIVVLNREYIRQWVMDKIINAFYSHDAKVEDTIPKK